MRQEDLIEINEDVSRALMNDELAAFDDFAFDEVIEAAVRSHAGDPEDMWEMLTYAAYDPKRVLRALKDHHDADSEIDPMLLMETFMETYDYRYSNNARFAIGTIVGFNHMRLIRTRGKRYWQTGTGHTEPIKRPLRK
jgi:hypothetical protein